MSKISINLIFSYIQLQYKSKKTQKKNSFRRVSAQCAELQSGQPNGRGLLLLGDLEKVTVNTIVY